MGGLPFLQTYHQHHTKRVISHLKSPQDFPVVPGRIRMFLMNSAGGFPPLGAGEALHVSQVQNAGGALDWRTMAVRVSWRQNHAEKRLNAMKVCSYCRDEIPSGKLA